MVKNKNTFVSCCSSQQMCSRVEYAKHIPKVTVILAYSVVEVYWKNKQKKAFAAEMEMNTI